MNCQEFVRKRGSSSNSSDNGDEGIVGNDEPTWVKVVQRKNESSMSSLQNSTEGVVIIYNTEETKQQCLSNDILSQSQKSLALSSKSRPSIYDEAQRGGINYFQNDGKPLRQNRPFRNNQMNIPYFDLQKYQYQGYRNYYIHQNQRYSNNYPRQNNYYQNYRGQKRQHYNNGRLENNHNYQSERNYQRNNNYEREERNQRQNFQNCGNYKNQRQPYQRRNHYNYQTQNYPKNNYQPYNNKPQYEQQEYHQKNQYYNNKQQQYKSRVSNQRQRNEKKAQKVQNTSQQKLERKILQKKVKSQKSNQKTKNLKQKKQQEKLKIQQNKSISRQPLSIIQEKLSIISSTSKNFIIQNKKTSTKNTNVDISSDYTELNKGHKNIEYQELTKSKDKKAVNRQQNEDSSDWDNSSNDSEDNKILDKSSFECQQLQLQFPFPPPIPNNHDNLSYLNEDLSFLQELGVPNKNTQNKKQSFNQQIKSENQSGILTNKNCDNSFSKNDKRLFSQEQFKILKKMFDLLPSDQSIFIEFKIVTSNVATYKIKNISSEVFNIKDTLIEKIKSHPFIKIKEFEKSVPRDILPHSNNMNNQKHNNENSNSKISKLVLAQILCPSNLLQHRDKFVENQQKIILKKIEKNKKVFEKADELIAVDQVTLRCSSCHNKKSFLWNNNLMPHQCKDNCPNFLRFNIESIHIC